MSTLCNIYFKYGNNRIKTGEPSRDQGADRRHQYLHWQLTSLQTSHETISETVMVTIQQTLPYTSMVSIMRERVFKCWCVWLHTSFHLQAVLATYSLNDSMPSSSPCPASWCKALDVAKLNTKWGAHFFYATSKLKYITLCLYIN